MRTKIRSVVAGTALIAASVAAGQSPRQAPIFDLGGAIGWLNSAPLSGKSLRGKVVLVDFWTYTCINSLRPLPYVKSWAAKYKDAGLVVIGVHTPEFSFEKEPCERTKRRAQFERYLSSRHRQQLQDLAGVQQPILARAIPRRCERANSLPPLWGRRIWRDRACHPETPEGKRSHWPGRQHG